MRGGFIGSVLFHAMVVVISYFGIPYMTKAPNLTDSPIYVEIVQVAEETNPPPPQQVPEAVPKSETKPEPPPPPPEPPKAEVQPPEPEPIPIPEPEPIPIPIPIPEPEPALVPKAEPKPEPKPLTKLAKVRPPRKPKPRDSFTSVLKALESFKKRPPNSNNKPEKKKTPNFDDQINKALVQPSKKHNTLLPLAISEVDAVRQQIQRCWNPPTGAKEAENLVIEVALVMNRDGTVREARIVDGARMRSDEFFRVAAESARRAVLNPRCNPLKLPSEKFMHWQQITLNFNPRDMF